MTTMTMMIRDILVKDPIETTIPNDGVAEVSEPRTPEEEATLRYELHSFVCEGQYEKGLEKILRSYVEHIGEGRQPAVWVSGFYGSGKSHLLKVLRYLWTDFTFTDGASARGLTDLPADITALLRELSTLGKRGNGLHAAAGKLSQSLPIRLGLLAILFRSKGLPEEYPIARFVMWMRDTGIFGKVKASIEAAGKELDKELRSLYVSPVLAQAVLDADASFASSVVEAKRAIREQYPPVPGDLTDEQMLNAISDLLAVNGQIPGTLIVLDELQQYIGNDGDRAFNVQLVTEACSDKFGGRLLFVGSGQSALFGTQNLNKIQARFTVQIELSDNDVEVVTRKLVLAKKATAKSYVATMLTTNSGEIDRQLRGTRIEPNADDRDILSVDYPILPVRRRFWERVLRAVDRAGTAGQLRTQLRIVHDAVRDVAKAPLGVVVPADYIYDELAPTMLQTNVLPRDIDDIVRKHRDDSREGALRSRLCALTFLIGQLPHDRGVDIGVRATPEMLADLMVDDLGKGSVELRKEIPDLLAVLVDAGDLMKIGEEYHIQTREGAAWDSDFRGHFTRITNDDSRIADERNTLLRARFNKALEGVRLTQGASKVPRKLEFFFTSDQPQPTGTAVPVWVRDGWADSEATVRTDAQAAGVESPFIFVYIPKRSVDELKAAIAGLKAAEETVNLRGIPTTTEGHEARSAMLTRAEERKVAIEEVIDGIFAGVRVFQGGGNEVVARTLKEIIEAAAESSLKRMYPLFAMADNSNWDKVITRARNGETAPLTIIGYSGDTEKHPVCDAVLKYMGSGRKGSDIRKHFEDAEYGWPRDAVDGALLALFVADLVSVLQNGMPTSRQALDQNKIGVADFKPVTIILTAQQRMAIRQLLQEASVPYKAKEETTAIPGYITMMEGLAGRAGGDAPLPKVPSCAHLDRLRQLSGNEQAVALLEDRDRLSQEFKEWTACAKSIEQRKPRWDTLVALLAAATGLPIADVVRPQVDAIRQNFALLDDPDPVAPLCDQLTDALRKALTQARQEYQTAHDSQMASLTASNVWKQLSADQQGAILAAQGIATVPAFRVADEAGVYESVQAISLSDWRNRTDALQQRFSNALIAAAKLLEPTTVQVKLPSAKLTSEAEVDDYLAEAKAQLMAEINAGHPVVI